MPIVLSLTQQHGLLAFAKYGGRVIGTKRLPVRTLDVLVQLSLMEAAGENKSPYTGIWKLTPAGEAKVAELIKC